MTTDNLRRRAARVLALGALGAVGPLAACTDFLTAENPGAIEAADLNSPAYLNLLTNGVIGDYQLVASWVNYYGALFTDELYNTHVFFEERLFDTRNVTPENGTHSFFLYGRMHRARFMADSVATRLGIILADSAQRDNRLARVRAYGGYSYVLLGENWCESPINVSAALPPSELFTRAIERFETAITVATAARNHTGASAASIAAADSIIAMARLGAARASLNLGNTAEAIGYATLVPADFQVNMHFSINSAGENNMWFGRLSTGSSGSNSATLSFTPFETMVGDPRVPRPATVEPAMNGLQIYIPNSPLGFSTYSGTETGADLTREASIRLASGLEARYIIAEAEGPTTETETFVNERRAVGNQLPVALAGDALMAELRDQKRRDFYLTGQRLGDLRRYMELYGINEFPTGPYPNTTTGETYVDRYCWPLNLAEINGNPNIP
ncbi:MAG TPA: hypothetical protein VMM18_02920 [Gemmatimonadaceae bacterium]|nr:hypothetical protein [Gemmatimonadaceae bacterium]